MNVSNWNSIMAETQFAVSQATLGVRELAEAIHPGQLWFSEGDSDVQYRVHNAFLSLTTALERLGKLAISLYEFRQTGAYPPLRNIGHDIGEIANRLLRMDESAYRDKGFLLSEQDLTRYATHLELLTDYAKGNRRYEYLDSLSSADEPVSLYSRWASLVEAAEPDATLQLVASVPGWIASALYRSSADQVLFQPYIDSVIPNNLEPRNVRVALDFFHLARWFGSILSGISEQMFYFDPPSGSSPTVPYLPEIIDGPLLHEDRDFAAFEILRVGDLDVTLEAIADALGEESDQDDEE